MVEEVRTTIVDLQGPTNVLSLWVRDFAADWSVRIKMAGEGTAQSGFQLVVEEMDNLELRKQRSRMFEQGIRKMYHVVHKVYNTIHPNTFGEESELYCSFGEPKLPTDTKKEEEIWSIRINEGRATKVDYFMQVHHMSRDEAEEKVRQINEENKPISQLDT